jgi:adenine-specific DNA-methyltransferase
MQLSLFNLLNITRREYEFTTEDVIESYVHVPQVKEHYFQLQNRRYIGNKYKLIDWIFTIINKECDGKTFADMFAGTGVIASVASQHFENIIINDFLHSNFVIYKAFFGKGKCDQLKINKIIADYNSVDPDDLGENYFSINFGGKYFSKKSAKKIGFIRDSIQENRDLLTDLEYYRLLASLLYSIDKIANTVGHYDAYFKKDSLEDSFYMKPIDPVTQKTDVVYLDPPYNSRQYSRFYHILETLTKWDKPSLFGTALKPQSENMSDYSRVSAGEKLSELVNDLNAKYIVTSYNNTYESKSNSSQNKISLDEINRILNKKGRTKVFEKKYRHFNAGNTKFKNHKEYLFVTKVNHE